jgi:CBS domain-containing protein
MPITEFCVRNVVCGSRETTVVDAAALIRKRHVGNVIVIDQIGDKRVPVGIVTDRDIVVEVVAAGLDPKLIKPGLEVRDDSSRAARPVVDVHQCRSPALA